MFGCDAFYVHGLLKLVLCAGEAEPWSGILVPTEREAHAALREEFPALRPHEVLPKWLYLSESTNQFEQITASIVREIIKDNPLIGVQPEKSRAQKPKSDRKKIVKRPSRPSDKERSSASVPSASRNQKRTPIRRKGV